MIFEPFKPFLGSRRSSEIRPPGPLGTRLAAAAAPALGVCEETGISSTMTRPPLTMTPTPHWWRCFAAGESPRGRRGRGKGRIHRRRTEGPNTWWGLGGWRWQKATGGSAGRGRQGLIRIRVSSAHCAAGAGASWHVPKARTHCCSSTMPIGAPLTRIRLARQAPRRQAIIGRRRIWGQLFRRSSPPRPASCPLPKMAA